MRASFRKLSIVIGLVGLVGLSGCGTIFDIGPVERKDTAADLSKVKAEAKRLADAYVKRAQWAANSAQAFEVPIIGAVITSVTALVFGAHPDVALAAGAVGGGLGAFSTYYAPRTRAPIYMDGYAAMTCIETLSDKTKKIYGDPSRKVQFTLGIAAASMVDAIKVDESEAAEKLSNAIDRVNANIFKRVLSATTPNMTEITENIRQSVQGSEQKKNLLKEGLKGGPNFNPADISAVLNSAQVQVALTLDTDITTCVSKAGS